MSFDLSFALFFNDGSFVLFSVRQPKSTPRRVVVTGAGITTALGNGWKNNSDGFRAGKLAFRSVKLFDASRHRAKRAAEIDFSEELPATRLSPQQEKRLHRASKMLLIAGTEAWQQAGWTGSDKIPLVLGTTSGGMTLGEEYYKQAIRQPAKANAQAWRIQQYQPQRQALDLCDALGFHGPISLIANACASGANAIGHAWELIRSGTAEQVVTGGYDALSEMVFSGFDSLQALSTTQCRPFDKNRDGLALGEGAAVLCLETLDSAKKRGAEILGEIIGYGASTDSHHLTQPHPQGDAALAAMNAACASAGVSATDIDYINAHGTGTPLNDVAEAAAINRWAGEGAKDVQVSSTKASIGHLLGAAGAVETVICLMALREQWLPATPTLETIDPCCNFQIVTKPRDAKVNCVLTNSFGFGGANATLVLRRSP